MKIIIDVLKFITMFLVSFAVYLFIIYIFNKLIEQEQKQECYEIYSTDNVILKKCEKYFEMPQE